MWKDRGEDMLEPNLSWSQLATYNIEVIFLAEGNLSFSQWTDKHYAFEILIDLPQALVLCLDGIHGDTNLRWNNSLAGRPFVLAVYQQIFISYLSLLSFEVSYLNLF